MDKITSRQKQKNRKLSIPAQMNVRADELATKERMRNYSFGKFKDIPTTTDTNIQVKINNRISTRLRPQEMYTQIAEKLGDKYCTNR